MPHYYYPGWVGVEIIRIKAVLSSTGLELELSLATMKKVKIREGVKTLTPPKNSSTDMYPPLNCQQQLRPPLNFCITTWTPPNT